MRGVGSPLIAYLPAESTATVCTTGPASAAVLDPPAGAAVVVGTSGSSTGGRSAAGIWTITVAPSTSSPVTLPATLAGWPTITASSPVAGLSVMTTSSASSNVAAPAVPHLGEPGCGEPDPVRAGGDAGQLVLAVVGR